MSLPYANSIPTDKHVFICGLTGGGKSFLAENYLRGYDYVVKLDTKNETEERRRKGLSPWSGLIEGRDFTVVSDFDQLDDVETNKIIYVPDFDDQTEENYNRFFRWIFERENTILWIDELMSVGSASRCPRELQRLMTQARSKNVGVWCCTQRPASVPVICLANSSYYFVFGLPYMNDRKRMIEVTGMSELKKIPDGYNFWYYRLGDKHPVLAVMNGGV